MHITRDELVQGQVASWVAGAEIASQADGLDMFFFLCGFYHISVGLQNEIDLWETGSGSDQG